MSRRLSDITCWIHRDPPTLSTLRPREPPCHGHQDPQARLPAQFSPVDMERLEQPSHPYPPRYTSSAEPFSGPGSKRDSGFSCFPRGSGAAGQEPASFRKGTSTENIFFKGLQSEAAQQAERPRYLQPTLGSGGWEGARPCAAGRPGPLWQVQEKKCQSPPPPPPLRSDSFAATKVFPYSEGPGAAETKAQNLLRSQQEKPSEARRSFHPLPTKDLLHPNSAADHNHNQLRPNKLFSLSSCDVSRTHFSPTPAHQRQYSDESPFYLQARSAPPTKTQTVGSYYRSLQDLPTNAFGRRQVRHSTALMAGSVPNPVLESGGPSRYYSLASKHSLQTAELQARQARQGKAEGWRREPVSGGQPTPPQRSGLHCGPPEGPQRDEGLAAHQGHDHNPWLAQEDHRISPLKTPLLHSLAQEGRTLGDATKGSRRSDRYATTLRKEVQQKRAQLQKSRSAATLVCDAEEDEAEEWRSTETSGVSFSNTYKDHLKEAQARVLQATSFQRRDLEPLGPESVKTCGRVRGRKRFTQAKRTHSFSEPDKMDRVGVEGEPQSGSFGERRRIFEARPTFSRPVLKPSQATSTDPGETPEDTPPSTLSLGQKQVLLEQQRLGTFAEYQARWNKQKKTQGRFHSAENILDPDEEAVCVHERSRSSPSADFYSQVSQEQDGWRRPEPRSSAQPFAVFCRVFPPRGEILDTSRAAT